MRFPWKREETVCSHHVPRNSSYRSDGGSTDPFTEVISSRQGCGVKPSRQSGSVRWTRSVQRALYWTSLLVRLKCLAELRSQMKSVTGTQKSLTWCLWHLLNISLAIVSWYSFGSESPGRNSAHMHLLSLKASGVGGLQPDWSRSLLIQADTLLENADLSINCSPSVIATITVIQRLLVKLQV